MSLNLQRNGGILMNTKLFNEAYAMVKSFHNRRLEMHWRHSIQWVHENIPTFEDTLLVRMCLGDKDVLKVFCNKDRTERDVYVDIHFNRAEDERDELTFISDVNFDLLLMTNTTGIDEDDLIDIAHHYAEGGIALTFDEAYEITHEL